MRLDRLVIAVPVLVALLATGTAYGYGIGIHPTVRDTVYPVCAHNGVHFNKQGHANCGLHRGWATASSAGDSATAPPTPATHPAHPGKPGHTSNGNRHGGVGHSGTHGHGRSASAPGHNKS